MRIEWRTNEPPSERDEYLVQLDTGGMVVCEWSNVNPFWPDLTTNWHWYNLPQFTKAVAWMPLPAPYRKTELQTKCDTCKTYWNCQGQCDEMPQIDDEPQMDCPKTCPSRDICTRDEKDCVWK